MSGSGTAAWRRGRQLAVALVFAAGSLASWPGLAAAAERDTVLVSRPAAAFPAPGAALADSGAPSVSSDGRYVAFVSGADNLSPDDNNNFLNVFVRDTQSATTTLVSRQTAGAGADGDSYEPSISADGRYVAFASAAANLSTEDVDTPLGGSTVVDVFRRDLQTNTTTFISRASAPQFGTGDGAAGTASSRRPSISADGNLVAFDSESNFGSDGPHADVFVRNVTARTTTLISRRSAADGGGNPDGPSRSAAISADGGYVAFASNANNLSDEDDVFTDIFRRNTQTATTELVSGGVNAMVDDDAPPAISADGRKVAWYNGAGVFVRDMVAGATERVSRASVSHGGQDAHGDEPSISADGRYVAFRSLSSTLLAPGAGAHADSIYVRDLQERTTALVSRQSAAAGGTPADAASAQPAISGDGRHVAFASDANNLSVEDNDSVRNVFLRTLDRTPPQTTITNGPSGATTGPPWRTAQNKPAFSFSSGEPGSSFLCRFDGASFSKCSASGTHAPTTALGDGTHVFEVKAVDDGGVVDPTPAARTFTVDTTPPETTITTGPSGPTSNSRPTFGFSATGSGNSFECRFDNLAWGPCSQPTQHTAAAPLTEGPHNFQVRAADDLGNTDPTPASRSFVVDTQPPDTQIGAGPTGSTHEVRPTFSFSSSEPGATFECRFDAADFGPCSGTASHTPSSDLSYGTHTFEVRSTDAAGNTDFSPAARTFSVEPPDTQPPDTLIDTGPSGPTADPTPTFSFSSSEPGSTFECRFDAGGFGPCSGPGASHTPDSPLADGPHTFEVRATDAAGNVDPTPAQRAIVVDTSAPDVTIDDGPEGPTNDASPVFRFSSPDASATFLCRFGTDAFAACSGPGATHAPDSPLPDGQHTFEVLAEDPAGNRDQSPAIRSFVVDTVAPEVALTAKPRKTVRTKARRAKVAFRFGSEPGAVFSCALDGAAYSICESPRAYKAKPGRHTFKVRAADAAGNTSAAVKYAFKVKRIP